MADSKWYDSSKDDDIMKEKLKIQQTNTKYDELIMDWGEEANSEIDERLSVALDTIPVNDVAVSKILKNAAMLFIRSQYRETLNNEKGAQRDWKRFLDKIDAAVTKAKSNPLENTRAKPTLHSENIRSYPISPSATGIFLGY